MSEKYTIIDQKNWKRAGHCAVFRNAVQPQYCVGFELDVTVFHKKVKERGLSFTLAFIYAVTECANGIEEFRYRFQDGEVVLYDRIGTSFTYLDKGTELFKVVHADMQDDMEEYVRKASQEIHDQKDYFTGPPGNDVYQFSAIPWITFTSISHTDSGKEDNAVPLFDWGRYSEKNGRLMMPFSVQVHHSFVDGLHIGRFAKALQDRLDSQ